LATIALPLCVIAEQLPIRSYTTADGLASDHIDCIVPDSRGFVWFCTPEGLTRFDGYRMVTFGTRDGLPGRAIQAFLETRTLEHRTATRPTVRSATTPSRPSPRRRYSTGRMSFSPRQTQGIPRLAAASPELSTK